MKIAIIRQKFVLYGGAEQFADGYIHQLAESGHEIHILLISGYLPITKIFTITLSQHLILMLFSEPFPFLEMLPKNYASKILILFKATKKPGYRMFIEQAMGAT